MKIVTPTRLVRFVAVSVIGVGTMLWTNSLPAYQTRPSTSSNNAAHAAAKGAMDSAKKQFDEATKRLNDLRPKHQQAEAEFKREQREHQQAREAVEREFEQAPELVRARETHAEAKKAYDDEHRRVVAVLKSQPAYQAALKAEQEAKERHDSPAAKELSDEVRKALAKEEFQATTAVRRLEEEAVSKDSTANAAHEREYELGDALARIVKKREAAINGNSRVSSTKIAFEKARDNEQLAQRELAAAQAEVNRSQRAYQSASSAFAAHEAQERQQQQAARARSLRGRRTHRR
jgi:chromosome segregation ATPase